MIYYFLLYNNNNHVRDLNKKRLSAFDLQYVTENVRFKMYGIVL